jgi:hypothetical protein
MKKTALIIFLFMTFSGCNTLKLVHIIKQGEIKQKNYYQEIPVHLENNIVYLNVTIGNNTYRFILDTGAPNIISSALADSLNLGVKCKSSGLDSQGNKSDMTFTEIEEISINDLTYSEQGAAIVDFAAHDQLSCFNIDGIIGANLMKNSIWQIDLNNKLIRISDQINSMHLSENAYKVPIKPTLTGTPQINMNAFGIVISDVILDYGSNSGIDLCSANLIDSISKNDTSCVRTLGFSNLGLFGGMNDTIYSGVIRDIRLGDYEIEPQLVDIKKTGSSSIGTAFLKNFIVTIDWHEKSVYFEKSGTNELNRPSSFGFNAILSDDKLIVAQLVENSGAYKEGLALGDQILKVNDMDYSHIRQIEYCDIVKNGFIADDVTAINLTFKKDTLVKTVRLIREMF